MIDLVYPLKARAGGFDDRDLRWSLRGVQQFVDLPIGDLWLFGSLPSWVRGARHVAMEDRGDKAINLIVKYRAMIADPDVSDPFLLMDDDHFFLRPTSSIPLHTWGTLEEHVGMNRGGSYGIHARVALSALRRAGLPTVNYQVHYPILIVKDRLRRALDLALGKPSLMASLYGNVDNGPTVEVSADYRVNTAADLARLHGGPFLSTSPASFNMSGVVALLTERYPDPSRWEAQ